MFSPIKEILYYLSEKFPVKSSFDNLYALIEKISMASEDQG